ncbi:hypothetical protein Ancab_031347 [Ancistrocladus abbreviatus]
MSGSVSGTRVEESKGRRWSGRSRTVARGGLRRRSPRLSAIYGGKGQPGPGPGPGANATTATELDTDDGDGIPMAPPSRSARSQNNKRRLPDSDKHALQSEPTTNDERHSTDDSSWLPEKHILELILDILQRRDTYEIFAEPVDQSEVEDYYEIIKEPMDFGTMRAKLHEGMYNSLQQFQYDVFLIFRNAMHFNTSATIFFRQARVLDDLAKKVFHALKADPKMFEVEFSSTRRRSGRRNFDDHRISNLSSCSKLASDSRIDCTSADVTVKGDRGERRHDIFGSDRRSTYRPWTSLPGDNDATITSMYNRTMPLVHMKQQDIGYKESLMSFVRDLGPTAHRVAKLKLQEWWNYALLRRSATCISSNDQPPSCNRVAAPSLHQVEPLPFGVQMTNPVLKSFPNHHLYERTDLSNVKRSREALQYGDKVDVLTTTTIDGTPSSHGNSSHAPREEGSMNSRQPLGSASSSFSRDARDIDSLVKIRINQARNMPAETVKGTGEQCDLIKPFEVGNLQNNQINDFDLNHSTGPELGLAYFW